jgi:hypothetical protein
MTLPVPIPFRVSSVTPFLVVCQRISSPILKASRNPERIAEKWVGGSHNKRNP